MITACSHCGTRYKLPDKMLGRGAKCKACGKNFLIAPAAGDTSADDVTPPERNGSTAQLNPVRNDETFDDPLDALASAANDDLPPPRSTRQSSHASPYEDDERFVRRRKAKGASLAMGTGIASAVFTVAAIICGIITMTSGDNQDLLKVMGIVTILLLGIGTVLSMIAVVNGTSATRSIHRARHPISGSGHASTGTITGGIAMLLLLGLVIAGSIWLINRGGLQFQETVIEGANT